MTIEEMTLMKWLNRGFYADKKVNALKMRVAQCRERATNMVSKWGDSSFSSGKNANNTENALLILAETEEKLNSQIKELLMISDEISKAISKLNDLDLETILIHRYLLFHSVEKTAEIMGYSTQTVWRKQKQAVQKLKEMLTEIESI